jgi:hypothetical protein
MEAGRRRQSKIVARRISTAMIVSVRSTAAFIFRHLFFANSGGRPAANADGLSSAYLDFKTSYKQLVHRIIST